MIPSWHLTRKRSWSLVWFNASAVLRQGTPARARPLLLFPRATQQDTRLLCGMSHGRERSLAAPHLGEVPCGGPTKGYCHRLRALEWRRNFRHVLPRRSDQCCERESTARPRGESHISVLWTPENANSGCGLHRIAGVRTDDLSPHVPSTWKGTELSFASLRGPESGRQSWAHSPGYGEAVQLPRRACRRCATSICTPSEAWQCERSCRRRVSELYRYRSHRSPRDVGLASLGLVQETRFRTSPARLPGGRCHPAHRLARRFLAQRELFVLPSGLDELHGAMSTSHSRTPPAVTLQR